MTVECYAPSGEEIAQNVKDAWTAIGTISSVWPSLPEPRVAKAHECPHCFRQRHPEPLTRSQAGMYDNNRFDPAYDASTDDSGVDCIGADYEGPAPRRFGFSFSSVSSVSSSAYWPTYTYLAGKISFTEKMSNLLIPDWASLSVKVDTWLPNDTYLPVGEPEVCNISDYLPIKWSDPENWTPWDKPWYPLSPSLDLKWVEWQQSFPVPESPGYDFSSFNDSEIKWPKGKKK